MKKIIVTVIIAINAIISALSVSAEVQNMMLEYDGSLHEYNGEVYSLVVNNHLINPPLSPIIFNDRALVPVREIFEEVGATVNYTVENQTVEVIGDSTYVKLRINDNVAYINGARTNIPDNVVPKLISKAGGETKTMVPVRFISENIGLDVDFNPDDGAILIESDGYSLAEDVDDVYAEPEKPKMHISDISYDTIGSLIANVTIITDGDIEDYSDYIMKDPERLVVDFEGAALGDVPTNISVNKAGISTIRTGENGERARVVIDLGNLKTYEANKTSDNTIEISLTMNAPKEVKEEKKAGKNSSYAGKDSSKLIVLDAGHGGSDSGAVGYINGNAVLEKNLTLQITNRVKNILENAGYTVSMTRTDDSLPTLQERPAQANEENAAVFVSIHINSVDNAPDANGTEVFYAEENNGDTYGTTSEKLAHNILERMLYYMGSTNRGVKTAEHAVTRRCKMPAALAEVGFITNPTEVYNMTTDDYQQKAAQGIAEGIIITLRDITVPN